MLLGQCFGLPPFFRLFSAFFPPFFRLGVIFNLIYTHQLPSVIEQPFAILADAFSAGALVMLGMSMAGRMFYLRGPRLLVALVLILMKTVILPIATKTVMHMLAPDDMYNANFAFIIATFPTAPGVLAFAMQYHVEPVQVASMVR